MNEVEVKILDVNVDELRKKLLSKNFTLFFQGTLSATYWDTRDRRLRKRRETLRLRTQKEISSMDQPKESVTHVLTMKRTTKGRTKVADETEFVVSDANECKTLLKRLGFLHVKTQKKHRESWKKENVHVEIDTLPLIPPFVEIEATTEEECLRTVQELGFSLQDAKPWTGKDVLKYYEKLKK